MKRLLITLSLCSLILTVKAQDYSGYTSCALQDSLALVAFYNATNGANWISNTADDFSTDYLSDDVLTYYTKDYPNAGLNHWFNGPVKDWFGVTLAKRQVGNTTDSVWRVIHLHPTLSRRSSGENNLKGYVPKEVGFLTALEWFKVNGNVGLMNTELPDELYHSSIIAFDFEGAFFSGILSSSIRNCNNLKYLNFRDNYFDSIPLFDFVTDPSTSLWVYRNQLSWATLESTIDYFVDKGYSYEARDQKNVGEAKEIVVLPGSSVTLTSNDAGSQGTYTWYKNGFNTYITGPAYTIEKASASDTGNYTVLIANEYIRLADANADYVNTFTKPIHLTFIPTTPVKEKSYSSYDGNKIYLEFNKPMASPTVGQENEFVVLRDGVAVPVTEISCTGKKNKSLVFELKESLFKGESISIAYTKGSVVDKNGGVLNSFSNMEVTNLVRMTPHLVNAITRVDGEGIILEFDQYIDEETFDPTDFKISCTNPYSVEEIILVAGEIDQDVSNKITLILDNFLWETDTLYVSYAKGSLAAAYGGAIQSFTGVAIKNVVVADRLPVNIRVVDGSAALSQIIVKGDFSSLPIILSDEDKDNIWTKTVQLNEGNYNWEVYDRIVEITYDTIITTNSSGEIVITLTPVENISDSLISGKAILNIVRTGSEISGDSIFNYRTNSLVFVLDLSNYKANNEAEIIEPYLMGINDDWTIGISMQELNAGEYTTEVKGFAIGDVVSYNYQNANAWENVSATTRKHEVVGNDTIYDYFGVFPSEIKTQSKENNTALFFYPNPASDYIRLSYLDGKIPRVIKVVNIYGQTVLQFSHVLSDIDISGLQTGLYFLISINTSGKITRNQFIKNK